MPLTGITFHLVPGIRQGPRRMVGFLEGHRELNAAEEFDSLKENRKAFVRSSIELWASGSNDINERFHGFTNDTEYSLSYVFKVKDNNVNHRFYGFLCNPLLSNPRVRVCVLCIHARKGQHQTDRAELARVEQWRLSSAASEAMSAAYPDDLPSLGKGKRGEVLPWKTK